MEFETCMYIILYIYVYNKDDVYYYSLGFFSSLSASPSAWSPFSWSPHVPTEQRSFAV